MPRIRQEHVHDAPAPVGRARYVPACLFFVPLTVPPANKKDVLRDEQFLAQLELKQDGAPYFTFPRFTDHHPRRAHRLQGSRFAAASSSPLVLTSLSPFLGPQVDYRKVFVVEYAGPMLFHLIVYFGYEYYYGVKLDSIKQCVPLFAVLHFP